ncbi:MAG: DUF5777 family beta-barrel protein [Bacteroidota bacterium]
MKKFICFICMCMLLAPLFGQQPTDSTTTEEDPFSMLEGLEDTEEPSDGRDDERVIATFKSGKVVNFHTIETLGKRSLGFRITHHFGPVNSGLNGFYGIDGPANVRLALDYSPSDYFQFGVGRTSQNKVYDLYAKYRFLSQKQDNSMPISMAAFVEANIVTLENRPIRPGFETGVFDNFANRMAYVTQIMIARKFSERFSLQIAPTYAHYNLVDENEDDNSLFALVTSGRAKLTKRTAITAEYAWRINDYAPNRQDLYNTLSLGFDVETGGHVFQMYFTNSFAINEAFVLRETASPWEGGNFRFGFNISRSFWL